MKSNKASRLGMLAAAATLAAIGSAGCVADPTELSHVGTDVRSRSPVNGKPWFYTINSRDQIHVDGDPNSGGYADPNFGLAF